MVNALLFVAVPLGLAFLVSTFKNVKLSCKFIVLFLLAFVYASFSSFFAIGGFSEIFMFSTAGFKPPLSIAFGMSYVEAFALILVSVMSFLFFTFSKKYRDGLGVKFNTIFLIFIAGINGLILTQDLFNLFIFNEIALIALVGLVFSKNTFSSYSSAFKFMIISSLTAGLFLIAITFIYNLTGSLYLKDILQFITMNDYKVSVLIPLILLFSVIIVELKAFPVNGWALDLYETANPLVSMLISTVLGISSLVVLYKLTPMFSNFSFVLSVTFLGTFVISNLIAIKQKSILRLLGYSSIAYLSLVSFLIVNKSLFGEQFYFIAIGLLITHVLSKTILFFLSSYLKNKDLKSMSFVRQNKILLFAFSVAIFALIGLPPFPSFFAKWELIYTLSVSSSFVWIGLILLGSLFEAVYLFKWFGEIIKSKDISESTFVSKIFNMIVFAILGGALIAASYFLKDYISFASGLYYIPMYIILGFVLFDAVLPVIIKNTVAIGLMAYYAYQLLPTLSGYKFFFAIIFLIGGTISLIPGYYYKGKREGFYPFVMMMFFALVGLITSIHFFDFFYNWELMTLGSYILILRGKKAKPHAYSYALFSIFGAYLMLFAIALMNSETLSIAFNALSSVKINSLSVYLLLFMAFMTKTASVPFHIWLPGAHSEAESDVSPMVSAILLKAGLLGIVILMLNAGDQKVYGFSLNYILSWVGVITALSGNLIAAMQNDAKRLLAYSSIGQLGYALFALTFMTHLGWLAGLAMAFNHFLFKSILFWTIGGVYLRTKTKNMYEMGGLISRMPLSFISVLISIIAVSGVPPLTGFAGKWLMFTAVIEKGWYLQGAVAAFAGIIGFLYLFRLIHSIFLGQLKDEHRTIKEAPVSFILPQYIFLAGIMLFSTYPGMILRPIGKFLTKYFPNNALVWGESGTATSFLGYWNGSMVMWATMAIFGFVFIWLWLTKGKTQKVKQFNIVFSAERPHRPETTHYAYNFFVHYKRALGFMFVPYVQNFWNSLTGFYNMSADLIRKIYNGNIQAYLMYIIGVVAFVYWILV